MDLALVLLGVFFAGLSSCVVWYLVEDEQYRQEIERDLRRRLRRGE